MKKIFTLVVLIFGAVIWANSQDSTMMQYTGKYKFPEASGVPVAEVVLQDNVLTLTSPMGVATLHHVEGDVFNIVELNGTAEFVRSTDKKVKTLKITLLSIEIEGAKEPLKKSMLFHPLMPQKFLIED